MPWIRFAMAAPTVENRVRRTQVAVVAVAVGMHQLLTLWRIIKLNSSINLEEEKKSYLMGLMRMMCLQLKTTRMLRLFPSQ